MKYCVYSGELITADNDSRAHVIPSALGGRLKPYGLLTREANAELNEKLDQGLVEALSPLMALLDASRDGGTNQPMRAQGEDGTVYEILAGQPTKRTRPVYESSVEGDIASIRIEANSMDEFKALSGRVKKEFLQVDAAELLRGAKWESRPIEHQLRSQFHFEPAYLFPGIFGIANLFAAHLGQRTHADFRSYVSSRPARPKSVEELARPPDTFYWVVTAEPIVGAKSVHHILAYLGDPDRKQALAFVQLFGLPSVAVILPFEGLSRVVESHCIDLATGARRPLRIDGDAFLSIPWQPTHEFAGLQAQFREAFVRVYREMQLKKDISEIHEAECAQGLTKEALGRINVRMAALAMAGGDSAKRVFFEKMMGLPSKED